MSTISSETIRISIKKQLCLQKDIFPFVTPFFIIAVFVSEHALLSWGAFLGFSALLGKLLYRKKEAENAKVGILAVIVSLLPIAIAQAFYAIPYILSHNGTVGITFEWLIVTIFTVGISFFVIQISLLFQNAVKHLTIASVYLLISVIIIL